MYKSTHIRVEAHRGVMTEAPENTLAAYRLAASQGYDIIELDPRFTKDGVCVLMHDATLNRTCRIGGKTLGDKPVYINDLNYADFAELDAGIHFSAAFAGERVPTLLAAIDLARENGIELRLDRKFEIAQYPLIFDLIEKHGDGVSFSIGNSDLDALRHFAKRYPYFAVNYDGPCNKETLDVLESFGCEKVNVWCCLDGVASTAWYPYPKLSEDMAKRVRERGFGLGVWEIETDEQLERAMAFEPDLFETPGNIKP